MAVLRFPLRFGLCRRRQLPLAVGSALRCAHNAGFVPQDFCSLLETVPAPGLALRTKQRVQPGIGTLGASLGTEGTGQGTGGTRSWGCRSSCGSGLAARDGEWGSGRHHALPGL